MTTPMPVAERERLARQHADELAPMLRSAINKRDAERIADLLADLDRQQLLALVVVLASQWPATVAKPRKFVDCWGCRKRKRHEGHGLCRGCHVRWDDAGRPGDGPPPALPREQTIKLATARWVEKAAERLEDYADLASWHVSNEEAAERLGVSIASVRRYRRHLRESPIQLRIFCGDQQRRDESTPAEREDLRRWERNVAL